MASCCLSLTCRMTGSASAACGPATSDTALASCCSTRTPSGWPMRRVAGALLPLGVAETCVGSRCAGRGRRGRGASLSVS